MNFSKSRVNAILTLFSFLIIISSCTKENADSVNHPPGAENGSGRFSDHKTCDIIQPPTAVGLNSYYKKYTNCSGIPVVASNAIPDEAMHTANHLIDFMLRGNDDVRNYLIATGSYYALTPDDGAVLNEAPGVSGQTEGAGGVYFSNIHLGVSSIFDLVCISNDNASVNGVFVHEMVHMIHLDAMRHLYPEFEPTLQSLYSNAMANNLWVNTHAGDNYLEYIAAGVTIWYGMSFPGAPATGDGNFNHIIKRSELQQYDAGLYNFIAKYFHPDRDVPGCLLPVVDNNVPCPASVTDVEGNTYEVVSVGSQCWMKENLKTSHYNDYSEISEITDENEWSADQNGAWSYYDNNTSNNNSYGKLYNWHAIASPKGICPQGWHIPSKSEMQLLISQTGANAENLQSSSGWNNNPNVTPNNSSGFTALPGGQRASEGFFNGLGSRTNFWTSTEDNTGEAFSRPLFNDNTYVFTDLTSKNLGFSVRCVKN